MLYENKKNIVSSSFIARLITLIFVIAISQIASADILYNDGGGNTPKIAERHYLQVTEGHFNRASGAAQKTARFIAENEGKASQGVETENSGIAVSSDVYNALRIIANFCNDNDLRLAPRVGFEPTT